MELDFNFISLVDFLGAVQGTLLGMLLMLQGRKHISYFLLGLFIFGYSLELFTSVLDESNAWQQHPQLLFLPINFYLLFMPCLYLYAQSMTRKINLRKEYHHFLLGIAEFIIFSFLFFQNDKMAIYKSERWELFEMVYLLIAWILITGYSIMIIQFVNNLRKKVENFYSNVQGKLLNWVKWVAMYVVAFNISMILTFVIPSTIDINWINPIIAAINVIFIFWVALSGFRQTQVELLDSEIPLQKKEHKMEERVIYAEMEDSKNTDFERVKTYLNDQKSFKNPQLHLSDLANELHLSQRKLSTLINEKAQLNFNQFINRYRVEEAKLLLVDEKFTHLNMLGIAYEVGFNSKATFYAVFKQMTGTTPNKFQKAKLLAS